MLSEKYIPEKIFLTLQVNCGVKVLVCPVFFLSNIFVGVQACASIVFCVNYFYQDILLLIILHGSITTPYIAYCKAEKV